MPTARDRLLSAAERCFEGRGIAATGINDLIAEADVARMSLYNHFSSKDELVVAYLRARDELWNQRVRARLANVDDPRTRLLTVIHEYGRRVADQGFRGCVFVNAAAELPSDHPGWQVIREHKDGVRRLLRSLAEQSGVDAAEELAEQLFLLAEGAVVTAGIQRSSRPFALAEQSANRLLDAYQIAR